MQPKRIKLLSLIFVTTLLAVITFNFGTKTSMASSESRLLQENSAIAPANSQNRKIENGFTKTSKSFFASDGNFLSQTDSSAQSELSTPPSGGVVQYADEVAVDLPAAFYRFNETSGATVTDYSGNSRNLTLSGSYTRNASDLLRNQTVADKGLTLAGAASATTVSPWLTTSSGMTVEFLINFSTLSGTRQILTTGTFSSPTSGYHEIYYNGSNKNLYWVWNKSDGSGFNQATLDWIPVIGQTYHVAVVQDYAAPTVKFYIDGLLVQTNNQAVAPFTMTNKSITLFSNFQGTIDEVAIFNTALPAARIRAQFAAARGADAAQIVWYASPTGTAEARGTSADPLDLITAFNFSLIQPGSVLKLKTGSYTGVFDVKLSGAANARITIKPETTGTATLDGAGLSGDMLTLSGSFLDVSGLEIRKTWAVRETNLVIASPFPIQGTNGGVNGSGIVDKGAGNKVYYNIIHDCIGDGIDSFGAATDSEYYGNLIFNNGWFAPRSQYDVDNNIKTGNGHGIYTQNPSAGTKKIWKNIFFNPYSSPLKAAGSGSARIKDYNIKGNLSIGGTFGYDIGGGEIGVTDTALENERTFNAAMLLGYNTTANNTISLLNSYIYGRELPLQIQNFNSIVSTGNTVIGQGGNSGGVLLTNVKTAYANSTVNNNTYYHNRPGTAAQFFANNIQGYAVNTYDWNGWKTTTGWDANSTYVSNGTLHQEPTVNKVFVEAMDAYELNRGYVAVYNWANASTQSVNLTGILQDGATYEIRSVSNYYAGVIASGTFSAASPNVSLPLTVAAGLPAQVPPYGDIARNPEPAPKFAAFLIVPIAPKKRSITRVSPIRLPRKPEQSDNRAMPSTLTLSRRPSTFLDFDGDGKADLSVYRPTRGVWNLLESNSGYANINFGIAADKSVAADYDGDGKTDIAVWRDTPDSEPTFYILESSTNILRMEKFGQTGDVPSVVGDWDGDGKADVAVYHDAEFDGQSYFLYRGSFDNLDGITTSIAWGTNRDLPQRGDFDGDGKADAAVFRRSDNTWYILRSSDKQFYSRQWGNTSDRLVPADYDGDGKTDLAVYRNGVWHLLQSKDGIVKIEFGIASDEPAPADYDGDGKTDLAFFRNGVWHLLRSKDGFVKIDFGLLEDTVTAGFLPLLRDL